MGHAYNSKSLRADNIKPEREGFMNCVRCSACRATKATDLAPFVQSLETLDEKAVPALDEADFAIWARQTDEKANVRIFCGKVGHERRARLFECCGEANPTSRWRLTEGGNKVLGAGNRTDASSRFEREFVRLAYPRASKLALRLVCDRDYLTIIHIGNVEGVTRDRQVISRALESMAPRQRAARVAMRNCFNDQQSAYILARFTAGKNRESFENLPPRLVWPRKFSSNQSATAIAAKQTINQAIKSHIVNEVAKLGHEMSWDAIRRHPEVKAPGYYRKHKNAKIERMARGPKNNSLSRPQKRKTETPGRNSKQEVRA